MDVKASKTLEFPYVPMTLFLFLHDLAWVPEIFTLKNKYFNYKIILKFTIFY